jgi:hypothetical protein
VWPGRRSGQHAVDQRRGIVAADRTHLARRVAAAELPVFETGRNAGDAGERPVPGDRPFERKLHGDRRLDLGGLRHRAGLVIDDREPAIGAAVDTVGNGGNRERSAGRGENEAALALAETIREPGAAPGLFGDEPARDPLETRPPETPDAGAGQQGTERRLADPQQRALGIGGKVARMGLDEIGQRVVDRDAEIGAVWVGVERVAGLELEDVAGVDRIGVAQPGLDLRDRQPPRPRGERRARRREGDRAVLARLVA